MHPSITRRGAVAGAVALTAVAARARGQTAADPVAATTNGRVSGTVERGVKVFKGIRYGADTAPNRFGPPRKPERWTEVRPALAYGAASPQRGRGETQSEDCLFLNVWTPGLRDGGKRPVLFYIHGGAYSSGSGSSPLYDGVNLCTQGDVVVVTVNHRLNIFGYLYLGREADPRFADGGNAGLLDLVLALQWVRDNIAEFGGDPSRVTVFGQSGGGAKIATMMAQPVARDLFHRAWTMSGQQVTASGPMNATRRGKAFLDELKLPFERHRELLTMPVDRLLAGMSVQDPVLGFGGVYFGPVLDERWLFRHPFYPDAAPQSAHIPMILGNTHDETRAFLGGDPHNFELTWEELPAKLPAEYRVDISPDLVVAEYRKLYPNYSPSDVFFAATTAGRSWRGAIIETEERAKQGGPTWAYQVDFRSPLDGGRRGAPHGIDIPLMFNNIAQAGSNTGSGPEAQACARAMSEALLAFGRTGDPNNAGLPAWKKFDLATRTHMIFDTVSRPQDDPRGAERRLFEKVPFIQAGT
jgi:para-nitrobenzyl esterase